ncbi:MAG: sugar phosphate isomerase/epimerase [Lachnospiraceae bacterium]|nr:sugar phosphate isomerase/epimerase [Lachnospiraceae bacterium]
MKPVRLGQFAAMNMVYNRHSFEYFLDSMERLEVKNFELWTGAPHLCNFINSLSDVSNVRREIRKRNLNIVCVTPEQVMYPHNIAAANKELRRWSLEYFHKYIEQTAELGVDKMLCCAGWGNYDENKEEAYKRSVESLQEMTEHAERAGIVLAFEILCPYESNLVNDFTSTIRIMNEIQSQSFKLCVDTVPVRLGGNTLEEFFNEFGRRICHVHLTDGRPTGHVPCGDGDHPIDQYLNVLSQQEYEGFITLEIGDTSWSVDPELATKKGFDTIKKYLF